MSEYENVVGGKLKLKGKALDVKAGGVKKKKKNEHRHGSDSQIVGDKLPGGGNSSSSNEPVEDMNEADNLGDEGRPPAHDDNLTPAERRYIEQRQKIDLHRLAKSADKSHRDRIEDFNQYLANLSEHYDIPKVGPG